MLCLTGTRTPKKGGQALLLLYFTWSCRESKIKFWDWHSHNCSFRIYFRLSKNCWYINWTQFRFVYFKKSYFAQTGLRSTLANIMPLRNIFIQIKDISSWKKIKYISKGISQTVAECANVEKIVLLCPYIHKQHNNLHRLPAVNCPRHHFYLGTIT